MGWRPNEQIFAPSLFACRQTLAAMARGHPTSPSLSAGKLARQVMLPSLSRSPNFRTTLVRRGRSSWSQPLAAFNPNFRSHERGAFVRRDALLLPRKWVRIALLCAVSSFLCWRCFCFSFLPWFFFSGRALRPFSLCHLFLRIFFFGEPLFPRAVRRFPRTLLVIVGCGPLGMVSSSRLNFFFSAGFLFICSRRSLRFFWHSFFFFFFPFGMTCFGERC